MNGSWVTLALVSVALLTPPWLAIPYFNRHYGVSGGVFVIWYFLGAAASIAVFEGGSGKLVPSWGVVAAIVAIGLTFGGIGNNAIFTAVAKAPNPGLAVAIMNLTGLTTLIAAVVLAVLWPSHFPKEIVSVQSVIGSVLIIIGAGLIAMK